MSPATHLLVILQHVRLIVAEIERDEATYTTSVMWEHVVRAARETRDTLNTFLEKYDH
jgi:hypothetical protein